MNAKLRLRFATFVALGSAVGIFIASPANAQAPAPAPAAPPPSMPPGGTYAAPEPKGAHYHDGFYLRLGAGIGWMGVTETTEPASGEAKLKGTGTAWHLTIGGTIIPGLAIGGTLFTHIIKPSVETAAGTVTADKSIFSLALGPTVDWFPDPAGGFHAGAGLGWGTMNAINYTSTGYELHVFTGYDFFFSDNWSVGPMLQLSAQKTSKDNFRDSTTSISLMVTLLDH